MTNTPPPAPLHLNLADIRAAQRILMVTVHNWTDAHDYRLSVERVMREKAARVALDQHGLRLIPEDFECTWGPMAPESFLYRLEVRWLPSAEPVLLVGGPGHGKLVSVPVHPLHPTAEVVTQAPVPDFIQPLRPADGPEPCREIRIRTLTYKLSGFSSARVTPEGGRFMFSVAKVVG